MKMHFDVWIDFKIMQSKIKTKTIEMLDKSNLISKLELITNSLFRASS